MEKPDQQDLVFLQSLRELQSQESNTSVSSEPEQEQQDESEPGKQPESDQEMKEMKETRSVLSPLALTESRIQQLHNRRFFLLKMQQFRKKVEQDSDRSTDEMTSEDSTELFELEVIEKELEELLVEKEELKKQEQSSNLQTANGGHQEDPTLYKSETPFGGVYMLPPLPLLEPEVVTQEQRVDPEPAAETPPGPITPVDSLGPMAALTQCPTCGEFVVTETHRKVGEAVWIVCCLTSMIGFVLGYHYPIRQMCFVGCCFFPFYIDNLMDVHHHCPLCQACIHIYRPF